jgi:hypothetical protein
MDFKRVLGAGLLVAAVAACANYEKPDAETLFSQSTRLFALENARFTVHATQSAGDRQEQRTFMVARRTQGEESLLLIRFMEPKTIECTAVLTLENSGESTHYVYFPSLKRVRMIPNAEKDKEVVGLGISYRELDAHQGRFDPVETVNYDGRAHYRIVRHTDNSRSVYLIDPTDHAIRRIAIYHNGNLDKEVIIDAIGAYHGKAVITAWRVFDTVRGQEHAYRANYDSISEAPDRSLFHRNRLQRCHY